MTLIEEGMILIRRNQIIVLSLIPITRILDSILTFIGVGYLGYHELNSCMAGIVTNLPLVICLDIGVSAAIIAILYIGPREKYPRIWMATVMIIVIVSTTPVILNIGTLLGVVNLPESVGAIWSVCT